MDDAGAAGRRGWGPGLDQRFSAFVRALHLVSRASTGAACGAGKLLPCAHARGDFPAGQA